MKIYFDFILFIFGTYAISKGLGLLNISSKTNKGITFLTGLFYIIVGAVASIDFIAYINNLLK